MSTCLEYVSQNLQVEILTPAIDDIRRWELWRCFGDEGGALMNGISVLIKETSQAPSPLLPCGDTASSYQNQMNQEKGPHQIVTMVAP